MLVLTQPSFHRVKYAAVMSFTNTQRHELPFRVELHGQQTGAKMEDAELRNKVRPAWPLYGRINNRDSIILHCVLFV